MTSISEEKDWIYSKIIPLGMHKERVRQFIVNSKESKEIWASYAGSLPTDIRVYFVFETFRNGIETVSITPQNQECLRWLTELYSGLIPNDTQIGF